MLFDYQEVATFRQALLALFRDVDRLAFGEGALEPQCLRRHLLALVHFALHLVLQAQCKEVVDRLLEHLAILQLPEPRVEAVPELLPDVLFLIIARPFVEQYLDLALGQVRHLADNTLVLHKAVHDGEQVVLRDTRLHVRVILLEHLLDLVLFPLHQFIFRVLSKVVLVLLFHGRCRNASVLFLLEEEARLLQLRLFFFLLFLDYYVVVFVQVFFAF